jgi:hypothetical protein
VRACVRARALRALAEAALAEASAAAAARAAQEGERVEAAFAQAKQQAIVRQPSHHAPDARTRRRRRRRRPPRGAGAGAMPAAERCGVPLLRACRCSGGRGG